MAYRWPMHEPHPVHLVVEDDYTRTRLTVFFRLILAIPHFIWFALWTLWIVITGFVNWLISIFTGRPPQWFHGLMCSYVRYQAHLSAYLALVQVVLLSRLPVLERLAGFDRLTQWHRWNGHLCIDLVIVHVVLSAVEPISVSLPPREVSVVKPLNAIASEKPVDAGAAAVETLPFEATATQGE